MKHPLAARLGTGRSARLRLTAAFTLLVAVVGAAIVLSVFLAMTFVPDYQFATTADSGGGGAIGGVTTTPDGLATAGPVGDPLRISSPRDILRLLLTTSLIVYAIAVTGGAVLSWIVAGRVLRPVDAITTAARTAASGHLDHRIDLQGPPDEFHRLADTFDDMLARLEHAFDAHRRFAANASHELLTPLATTQAMLDVALLDPRAVDLEALTTRLRETNSRNIETVEALLALSDAQSGVLVTEPVDLESLVREVLATFAAAALERSIEVVAEVTPATISGDPTLLRLLVVNLVANAIRYNHYDGRLDVTLTPASLTVRNTGAVVDETHLGRLTEPFYRAEGRIAGSHGLGLALVAAIATAHAATLELTANEQGGLTVRVGF